MTRPNPSQAASGSAADQLCLDFVNTAEWHASEHPIERLGTYESLVAWGRRVDLLDAAAAGALLREAKRRPAAAAVALRRAVALREIIYRILVATLEGRPVVESDLARLNRALASSLPHLRVQAGRNDFAWAWRTDDRSLERMLWPVLRSAAELLTSDRLRRVGQCADDRGCGWLFLDTTKNGSRKWCEMKDCGNRAKARRHYQRERGAMGAAKSRAARGKP